MDTSENPKTMKMKGFRVPPEWNPEVTDPKWSRIIIRSFWAHLSLKLTTKVAPPKLPRPKSGCFRNFPWFSRRNHFFHVLYEESQQIKQLWCDPGGQNGWFWESFLGPEYFWSFQQWRTFKLLRDCDLYKLHKGKIIYVFTCFGELFAFCCWLIA